MKSDPIKVGSLVLIKYEPGKMPMPDSEGIVIKITVETQNAWHATYYNQKLYHILELDTDDEELVWELDFNHELVFIRQLTKEEMLTSKYQSVRDLACDIS